MHATRICFILPLLLASSMLLAQHPHGATPQQSVHKKVVKRHSHRRRSRTKAAPPTQTVEIINGTKTQTTVFSETPRTPVGQKASGRHRSARTKAVSPTATVEVTNGENTQTDVFGGNQRKPTGQKTAKMNSSTGTSAAPSPVTVEVINGTSEQTKVFSGTPLPPAQKTAPKPADPQTGPK